MKNKKLSWFLVPVVLSIWGAIGWQVYVAMKSDEDIAPGKVNTLTSVESISAVPDTFALLLDYRDPFLDKTFAKTPPVSSIKNNPTPPKTNPIVATITWPTISYSGLVRQPSGDRMLGFLSVNGKSHFVKSGDVIDGLSVGRVTKDSAEIIMGQEHRYFRK